MSILCDLGFLVVSPDDAAVISLILGMFLILLGVLITSGGLQPLFGSSFVKSACGTRVPPTLGDKQISPQRMDGLVMASQDKDKSSHGGAVDHLFDDPAERPDEHRDSPSTVGSPVPPVEPMFPIESDTPVRHASHPNQPKPQDTSEPAASAGSVATPLPGGRTHLRVLQWARRQRDAAERATEEVATPLDIEIYTTSDDGEPLREAVVELLEACGFESTTFEEPQRGSYRQRWKAALHQLFGQAERGAQLKYIEGQRSLNLNQVADAVVKLAEAMKDMDEAVAFLDSLSLFHPGSDVLAGKASGWSQVGDQWRVGAWMW